MSPEERLLPTEIPPEHWEGIGRVVLSGDDMVATMQAFTDAGREDGTPYNLMLGASGVILATQIRLYEGLGDLTDAAGTKIDDKRRNPRWLFPEAMTMLERQAEQQT